jgi:RND superfamily putative drug exporter
LAGAILIDAFVVRTVLVPSLMHMFGKANWWLPSWLDRALPHLNVEGAVKAAPDLALDELELDLELAEPGPVPEAR